MRLTEITLFILVILLTLSVGLNVFQYTARQVDSDPVPEIVTVSDTVVRIDTIFKEVTQRVLVEKPVPVYVDTANNVRTYRDTLKYGFGTIWREEVVFGELLSKNIEYDQRIPIITRSQEVNTTNNIFIRKHLFFATIGMGTDYKKEVIPIIGGQYVFNDHRMSISYSYSPFNEYHNFVIGLRLFQ